MAKDKIFEYENQRLKKVIEQINEKIKKAEKNFSGQEHFIIGFKEGQRGTQFIRQGLMSLYATEIYDLKSIINNPYFGRFEFQSNDHNDKKMIYIGKKTVTDNNNDFISYDWRSPICSMYYDYNIGDAEYLLGGKVEAGKILSKRQIIIKDGELQSVLEHDTISNDLILLKYLSENSDARLISIIATIQREQNKIIRSPLKGDYIVQGVAGSGKTTVALHRIAYLLYNYAKNIKESEFMILGPNKYFLNYISELLPDLDIKNVYQSTFDEIALKSLKTKLKLESKNETLKNVLLGKIDRNVIEYKNSLAYLKLVNDFVDTYMISHLQDGIVYEEIELCSAERLKRIYELTALNNKNSYADRINKFSKLLIKNIKENSADLCHLVWLQYKDEFLSLPTDSPRRKEIIEITDKIEKEIKKGCSTQIKQFFKFSKVNCLHLYQSFIETIDEFNVDFPVDIKVLKEYTLEGIQKKQIGFEDLAPLTLMCYLINGIDCYEKYAHIVIDEAQDLSLPQYYLLKKLFPKANFDVFGDVNQSIYDYQAITDWDVLNFQIFDNKANILNLDKSYRTTKQISNVSNLVLEHLNYNNAECIARDGDNILINDATDKNYTKLLIEQISTLLEKEYQTIAIICKDDIETKKVYDSLKKIGLEVNKVTDKNEEYTGGISVIPSYLSKGLEFDAVIINDANSEKYADDGIDQKLLYVAITRAMHELYINYRGEISSSLKSLVKLNKNSLKSVKKLVK